MLAGKSTIMGNITCKNCGNNFNGTYCNLCGQKVYGGKFTVKKEVSTVLGNIFNLDKGFFLTIKLLVLNPGKIIRDYLSGITKRYSHPIKFLLFCVTINVLILQFTGVLENRAVEINEMAGFNKEELKLQAKLLPKIKQYIDVIMFTILPILSFFSYLFFRKHKYNYTEHLLLNSFLFGFITIVTIALSPLDFIINPIIPGLLVWILYFTYSYMSIFKISVVKSFFISISIWSVSYISLMFIIIVMMMISIFIMSLFGVDLKEIFNLKPQ